LKFIERTLYTVASHKRKNDDRSAWTEVKLGLKQTEVRWSHW
jgi:hypothetical protein